MTKLITVLREVSPTKTKYVKNITYTWNLKKRCKTELIYKVEIDAQTWKTNLGLSKGKLGEG